MKRKIIPLLITVLLLTVYLGVISSVFAADEAVADDEVVNADGSITTRYGTIPKDYTDVAAFPLIVFSGGEFKGASSVFAKGTNDSAFHIAKLLMDEESERGTEAEIYLRADVRVSGRDSDAGQINGTLTIDLNGFALNCVNYVMLSAIAEISGASVADATFVIKNGTVTSNVGLIRCDVEGDAYISADDVKTMNFIYENIVFDLATSSSYPTTAFTGDFKDSSDSKGKKSITNITFNDCTIDLTDKTGLTALFAANDTNYAYDADNPSNVADSVMNVTMNGGSVISSSENFAWYEVNEENGSSVSFGQGSDGNYPKLVLDSGAVAPAYTTEFKTQSGASLAFVKHSSTDAKDTYILKDALWTPYGSIGSAYASVASYPFAVFTKAHGSNEYTFLKAFSALGTNSGAFQNAKNAVNQITESTVENMTAGDTAVIYMRRDFENSDTFSNAGQLGETIVLDLGGNTLTTSQNLLIAQAKIHYPSIVKETVNGADIVMTADSTYSFINGEILTTTNLITGGIWYVQYQANNKTFYINFDNVEIGFAADASMSSLLYIGGQNSTGSNTSFPAFSVSSTYKRDYYDSYYKAGFDIRFNNCEIDLLTNVPDKFTNFMKCVNATTVVKTSFEGTNFTVSDISVLNSVLRAARDTDSSNSTVEYEADEYYLGDSTVTVPAPASDVAKYAYECTLVETSEGILSVVGGTASGDYTVYTLGEASKSDNGIIPAQYESADDYPFLAFLDRKCIGGESYFVNSSAHTGIFVHVKRYMDNDSESGTEALIVMRRDFTGDTSYSNTGQINGNLTIDLGGNTLESTGEYFFNAQAKKSGEIQDATFNIKNGTLLLNNASLFSFSWYSQAAYGSVGDVKTMHWNFTDVKLDYGLTKLDLIGAFSDADSEATGKKSIDTVTFTNCVFDITNALGGEILFGANDANTSLCNNQVNMTVRGGKIIASTAFIENNGIFVSVNEENGSSVYFETDDNGNYTTLVIPEGTSLPMLEIPLSADKTGKYVKSDSTDGTDTYKLYEDSKTNIIFSPKSSVTLDSSIIFNLYLPVENIVSFSFDGVEYTDISELSKNLVTIDGKPYYHIEKDLPAAEAARDLVLIARVSNGTARATGKFTMSIPKYAEKIINKETSTDNERILAKDIIAYIKASYEYFDKENTETIERLSNMLDPDYGKISVPVEEGDTSIPTLGLADATFILDSTPTVRFCIADDYSASDFAFTVGGKEAEYIVSEDGRYIYISLYAYRMCETIEYTLGNSSDSYHINSYYSYVKSLDNEPLLELVLRFVKYCQSARAYRGEIMGDVSFAHTHSYYERSFELSVETPEYTEKICACGDSIKTLYTGEDFGDKPISVLFVGNSYTNYNNMSSIFGMIANAEGIDVTVTKVTKGGWHLYKYMNESDSGGAMLYAALEANDYDYVFLQDGSTQTIAAIGEFYDGVRAVGALAEADGAKVLLYQTWGRKTGSDTLTQYGLTNETMAKKVAAAYEAISEECGYTISPAGSAFLDVYVNHPEIELYDADLTHPSPVGSYLVALCHYATLFGRSPIGVAYSYGLDAETALILQTAAHNAVFGESIVTDEYKTSSVGVHAETSETALTAVPEGSSLISVGITGTSGVTASDIYSSTEELTDEQKTELANIENGVSIIGVSKMITPLSSINDGIWSNSQRFTCVFDGNHYFIDGDMDENEPYIALITYNFGEQVNIDAVGYFSGSTGGFAQAQDIYISNDGVSWTAIGDLGYDMTLGGSFVEIVDIPADANGNTSAVFILNGTEDAVCAQYVRIGITASSTNVTYDMNTFELAVYGSYVE